MRESSSILIYGRDSQLLDTRCWVLEQADYRVRPVLNLEDAEQAARTEHISVLVLCHSLSTTDREAAIQLLRSIDPELRMLTLTAGKPAVGEHTVSAFDGPRRLLEEVARLCSADTSAAEGSLYASQD